MNIKLLFILMITKKITQYHMFYIQKQYKINILHI